MKIFLRIFCLYFTMVAFQPTVSCGTSCGTSCGEKIDKTEMTKSCCQKNTDDSSNNNPCDGANCHCVCCGISIIQLDLKTIDLSMEEAQDWQENTFTYSTPEDSFFTDLIWQPPRA